MFIGLCMLYLQNYLLSPTLFTFELKKTTTTVNFHRVVFVNY